MAASSVCFVDLDEGAAMPAGWSPYPSPAEIAEHEALMVSLGYRDREHDDAPPHPDEVGEHPVVSEVLADPVQALSLLAGEGAAADAFDLCVLADLDPAALVDPIDQLAVLKGLDKVEGLVGSLRIRALTALGGTEPGGALLAEMHLEHEIAIARRTSDYAAGKALDLARTITTTFPEFLAALGAGRVSWGHLAVLVDRTRFVQDPAALAEIGARALVRALTRTPGQFGTDVEKLVVRFDPDAAERHRKARKKDRKVWVKQLTDGMGMLGYIDEWAVVNAVYETIKADAKAMKKARKDAKKNGSAGKKGRQPGTDLVPTDDHEADEDLDLDLGADAAGEGPSGDGPVDGFEDVAGPDHDGGDAGDAEATDADADAQALGAVGGSDDVPPEEPSADSDRADALAARVLGVVGPDGSVAWDRSASVQVHTSLVVDLLTLQGLREGIALLDGQPIPAEIAREYAERTTSWRRFVTDPDDGRLIDRGTEAYTDPHLRSFILARDICRNPVHQHASNSTRLEMDHAEEWPHGPTSAANCGGLCIPSHQLKTARLVDITDSTADGSCTWTTAWGQVVHIPPRPFLDTPDPPGTTRLQPAQPERAGPGPHAPPPDDDPPPF